MALIMESAILGIVSMEGAEATETIPKLYHPIGFIFKQKTESVKTNEFKQLD